MTPLGLDISDTTTTTEAVAAINRTTAGAHGRRASGRLPSGPCAHVRDVEEFGSVSERQRLGGPALDVPAEERRRRRAHEPGDALPVHEAEVTEVAQAVLVGQQRQVREVPAPGAGAPPLAACRIVRSTPCPRSPR
ncbi:hypothetical protein ACIBK9_13755 [Nonomuraea sp. NPDC050227]|uniref:hypothetical protein n=1 Tax=Nonomuraea sp. NPDC050227 TaxID=3364360 RepID=UPI0037A6E56F